MAKKRNKKGGTPLGKKGSKARRINNKADKSKTKKETVYYPAVIVKTPEEEPMCESEISYRDRLLAVEVGKLAAKGLTNDEIIKQLGIGRTTFYDKVRDQPYFQYALFKNRNIANDNVEGALYKRANGYKVIEKTTEAKPIKGKDEKGNDVIHYQLMTAKIVEKELPGDVKAQEFYLVNRMPNEYKRKVEAGTELHADMGKIVFSIKRRGD